MKIKIIILISSIFFSYSLTHKLEIEKLQDKCFLNSLPNNGKEVIRLYNEFERILVKKRVLKDKSARSYKEILKKTFIDKIKTTILNFSFIDSINKLPYSEMIHRNTKCSDLIRSHKNYEKSITYKTEKFINKYMKSKNFNEKVLALGIDSLTPKELYNLKSYKIRLLLSINKNIEIKTLHNNGY